jgi:hypothetical protein
MMCVPNLLNQHKAISRNAGALGARVAKAQRLAQSTVGGGTPPPSVLARLLPAVTHPGLSNTKLINWPRDHRRHLEQFTSLGV